MTLILRDATLIDGTGGEPKTKSSVVIEGDTIADITAQPTHRREDAQVYDLSGLTMLPGLIDAHAHLGLVYDFAAEGDPGIVSPAEIAARAFENCNLCLDAGFTTVRDMCGVDGGIGCTGGAGVPAGAATDGAVKFAQASQSLPNCRSKKSGYAARKT